MKRLALIAALTLAALTGPAFAATSGVSVDHSQGVLKLGDGTANCSHAADTGTVRFNSSTNRLQYCVNGSGWSNVDQGGGVLISTQTASGAASLQFNGSNWSSSYNTLILNCTNFTESADGGGEYFVVGEGAGPTWETGAHYTGNQYVFETGAGSATTGTTDGSLFGSFGLTASGGVTTTQLQINNVSSSSVYKLVNYTSTATKDFYASPSGSIGYMMGNAYWNNDKNPVTGIKLIEGGAGGFSGTCSLYGMN